MNFRDLIIEQIKKDYMVPKFRCETTIDTVLSAFGIEEIVSSIKFKGNPDIKLVGKEFPLKKNNNQSSNIDYLLIDEKKKILYLVELKTVPEIDASQLEIYRKIISDIKTYSGDFLITDFENIKDNSNQKLKYEHYFHSYLAPYRGIFKDIKEAQIIYILPSDTLKASSPSSIGYTITFEELSKSSISFKDSRKNSWWDEVKTIFSFIDEKSRYL